MEFRALGPLEVVTEGRLLRLGGPKQRVVLAGLLIDANRVVPADALIEQVWGQDPPAHAWTTLQVYVANLRKVLVEHPPEQALPRLERRSPGYVIHVGDDELDVHRFRRMAEGGREALRRGDSRVARVMLGEALSLWRGSAFPDLQAGTTVPPQVAALEEERLSGLQARLQAELDDGRGPELVSELDALTASYPLREAFHAQRIIALYRAGRQADALLAYQAVRSVLLEELGLDPGPELRRLETAVLQQDAGLDGRGANRIAQPTLPAPANRLIGRQLHVNRIASLLCAQDVRLVSLLGPGGTGKSRLALEVATVMQCDFPGGAFFVPLAAVGDHRLVLSTLAEALGVVSGIGPPVLERLRHRLSGERCLLVLDNFEHLLPAAPEIGRLLSAVPGCTVLVTSRAALRLSGEREYRVPPMSLPSLEPQSSLPTLHDNEAVQLFVERAYAVHHSFTLNADNAAAVARICHRLDGLPLALELAAARTRVLEPEAILLRLDTRLGLLTGGPRDSSARQQTLRQTIAWSYELLQPSEKELFGSLSVFAGGCDFDAVDAVAGGPGPSTFDPLAGLESLVAQSLLGSRSSASSGIRFVMLETIREYATERLDARPDAAQVRRRHAEHYLARTEAAAPGLTGNDQFDCLAILRADDDNLRAALHWGALNDRAVTLRLAGNLAHFWEMTGALDEGRRWLSTALQRPGDAKPELLLPAYAGAGSLAFAQGHYDEAERWHTMALETARTLGDTSAEAFALNNLGAQAWEKGHESQAQELYAQATALATRAGDVRVAGIAKHNLAFIAFHRAEYSAATQLEQEALDLARRVGDHWLVAIVLHSLARCAIFLDDLDTGWGELLESLDIAASLGVTLGVIEGLEGLADLAARSEQPTRAVRLLAAAANHRRTIGAPEEPADRRHNDTLVNDLRHRMTTADFEQAWQAGTRLSMDEVLAEARS